MKDLEKIKEEKEAQKPKNYVKTRGSCEISTDYCKEKGSQRELLVEQSLLFCCSSMRHDSNTLCGAVPPQIWAEGN